MSKVGRTKIVVIGGGFAGIEFIKHLAGYEHFDIILVDINNYNFFPPLIYQVATGFMEPSAISYPFRRIIRDKKNIRFRMGELMSIAPEQNKLVLNNGVLHYDLLILATGTTSNFFGNEQIAKNSLPMKTISDALALRNIILGRMERATRIVDREERKKLLTFVIAGAGPTGVELAGMFAEMRRTILKKDYPELDARDLGGIYLVDGQDAVLANMSHQAQKYSKAKLEDFGVKVKLNTFVKQFDQQSVQFSDGSEVKTENLIWAAGVTGKVFNGIVTDSYGRGNRIKTNRMNLVTGYENIYALGDAAMIQGDSKYPNGHPQMAQPAIQQARNLAKNLLRNDGDWKPFEYVDKGSMAIIGRNKAVLDFPDQKYFLRGFIAWIIWILVHIMSLINFKNKLRTMYNWLGYYINKDQYFRMIIRPRTNDNVN